MTATTMDVRTLRIEGYATLLSSLHHGGDHSGTTSFLRRERIMLPDGTVCDVPVVSGNSLRGILRDHAAAVMHQALGAPELPVAVFHLLWSGGALAKAGAGHVLGARQLAEVRRLIPVISLFGGSGAGKILEGKLRVGKLVPVCEQTRHLIPDLPGDDVAVLDVHDLLQIEEFTRRDDSKRDLLHPAIEGFTPAGEIGDGTPQAALLHVEAHQPAVEDAVDGPAQQMRYGFETLIAGVRLHWWMRLEDVTDVEVALMARAIDRWVAAGAHIGGRASTGHGRLRLDVHQWSHDTPTVTVGDALAVTGGDPLGDHIARHRDEIIEALGWFA